jgi:hypothetical protein
VDRDQRQAHNEALYRATNREIERASKALGEGAGSEIEFLCECGREGCATMLSLTIGDYDRIHAERERFVVLPGHENPEIEQVVERTNSYCVVDKFGEAAEIARDADLDA